MPRYYFLLIVYSIGVIVSFGYFANCEWLIGNQPGDRRGDGMQTLEAIPMSFMWPIPLTLRASYVVGKEVFGENSHAI